MSDIVPFKPLVRKDTPDKGTPNAARRVSLLDRLRHQSRRWRHLAAIGWHDREIRKQERALDDPRATFEAKCVAADLLRWARRRRAELVRMIDADSP